MAVFRGMHGQVRGKARHHFGVIATHNEEEFMSYHMSWWYSSAALETVQIGIKRNMSKICSGFGDIRTRFQGLRDTLQDGVKSMNMPI